MRIRLPFLSAALLASPSRAPARRPTTPASDTPAPVAATRPELKEQLERSKQSQPRLPLPPPTEQEIAAAKARAGRGPMARHHQQRPDAQALPARPRCSAAASCASPTRR